MSARFETITGPAWVRSLGVARARRQQQAVRIAVQVAACTNAGCAIRTTCGRFGRPAQVSSTWPGGEGCAGFQPAEQLVGKDAA